MKTMIFAAATVLGIGMGSAYAGDGEGPIPDTQFTEISSFLAQAQAPQAPTSLATNQYRAPTAAFVTGHSRFISLIPPNANQGNGS
jgi:hypothetical protein